MTDILRQIGSQLATSICQPDQTTNALDQLLEVTGARATGLWQYQTDALSLVDFASVASMSHDVHRAFREATTHVSLTQTGLGIVQAAAQCQPAHSRADDAEQQEGGSPTWLRRFDAIESLAVPIELGGTVHGVLAISTAIPLEPEDRVWSAMCEVATAIAVALP